MDRKYEKEMNAAFHRLADTITPSEIYMKEVKKITNDVGFMFFFLIQFLLIAKIFDFFLLFGCIIISHYIDFPFASIEKSI